MDGKRFVVCSLWHYGRIHAAVGLSVAVATAVLTGALLVGDSVRGSLRRLTLEGLGQIAEVLVTDRFFRSELADELMTSRDVQAAYQRAAPVVLFPQATVESPQKGRSRGVTVIGCREDFWSLSSASPPRRLPGEREVIINEPLAKALNAQAGDTLVVRLPAANQVPADSPLGRKTDRTRSLAELKIVEVIPAEGLGRFSLMRNQVQPKNAYLALETLQQALDQAGKVNAILVAGKTAEQAPNAAAHAALASALQPTLEDLGLSVQRVRRVFPADDNNDEINRDAKIGASKNSVIYDYFHITTDRLLFADVAAETIDASLQRWRPQPVFTYLAIRIEKPQAGQQPSASIPYSMITALDSRPDLSPLLAADGKPPPKLADDEIVLTSWAADDLNAHVGDEISVAYFAPETTHGQAKEVSTTFRLKAIVPLTKPSAPYDRRRAAQFDQRPTPANNPDLTPVVKGFTDQQSIDNWDPPFPYNPGAIRSQDEGYWDDYRTTPKAYVSLAAGRRLWGSRFGDTTSYRIAYREGLTTEAIAAALRKGLAPELGRLGFEFNRVKYKGLQASQGTTPFDVLFLGFSFFIIFAALILVALLFRLGVEQRAGQVGLLLAVGLPRRRVQRLILGEALVVASLGAVAGVLLGVGYAWLMLAGLRTWWLAAVTSPFLELHITGRSLFLGYVCGVLASWLAGYYTLRQMRHLSARDLLAGRTVLHLPTSPGQRRKIGWALAGQLLLAALLIGVATQLGGEAQAGAFFGSGVFLLSAALTFIWRLLRGGSDSGATFGRWGLAGLAARNAGRNPSRSTMTIGLVASASFLIIAISAFRLAPTEEGVGGFDFIAESDLPIFSDLNTPAGADDVLGQRAGLLADATVFSLRVQSGDDASCRNLYKPAQPRVLGVPRTMADYFSQPDAPGFGWAGSLAKTPEEKANPWLLLAKLSDDGRVPVVLDKNTAMYSLGMYLGAGEEFSVTYDTGETIDFRVVGLLSNSVLQGSLLIDEQQFIQRYPTVSGYRYFLIRSNSSTPQRLTAALEEQLSDQGFDAQSSETILINLLAVQNTYLSTFQSLGALGLLLGVVGLATVQLRNVFERRQELALLRAAGFRRRRLAEMVLLENLFLLLAGLGAGAFAAVCAVAPHLWLQGSTPPLQNLAMLLGLILAAGLLSGLAAVRSTLQAPLISALRGE